MLNKDSFKKHKYSILTCAISIVTAIIITVSYQLGTRSAKRIAVNFDITENTEVQETIHKYQFLSKDLSDYICSLSDELDIDSDLIVAVLMVENPEFNPDAIHKNLNGTIDCGLFQLNDRYIWTSFKDAYWFDNLELNPFNWKHNTYLAIHHIAYLQKKLKVTDEVICAYNCGISAVMSNTIPDSTRIYLKRVTTNLFLLKNSEN